MTHLHNTLPDVFPSRQVTNDMCLVSHVLCMAQASYCGCMCVCVCSVPTHPHRPHQTSSCRGSRWRGPRRTPTGWCGSAIVPCRGPPSGPGRPAWPSAAGHSSRGVRLAASWMAVSCPPRQIRLTPKRRVEQEVLAPNLIGAKNLVVASGSRSWREEILFLC